MMEPVGASWSKADEPDILAPARALSNPLKRAGIPPAPRDTVPVETDNGRPR